MTIVLLKKALSWIVIAGLLSTAACAPRTVVRGNPLVLKGDHELQTGVTTQEQVRALLGSPSMVGVFDQNVWYYNGKRTRQWAFFKPQVLQQHTLVLNFDEQGVLQQTASHTGQDADIALAPHDTSSEGARPSLLEQILGNFGRVAQPQQP